MLLNNIYIDKIDKLIYEINKINDSCLPNTIDIDSIDIYKLLKSLYILLLRHYTLQISSILYTLRCTFAQSLRVVTC